MEQARIQEEQLCTVEDQTGQARQVCWPLHRRAILAHEVVIESLLQLAQDAELLGLSIYPRERALALGAKIADMLSINTDEQLEELQAKVRRGDAI